MTPANTLLTEAVRHALNDGECADWFVRAHEPRQQSLDHRGQRLADGDGVPVAGPKVFGFTHEDASA